MKSLITVLVSLTFYLPAIAQSPVKGVKTDTTNQQYLLQYDPGVLRVKGNSVPIGIVSINGKGQKTQTEGFLNGTDNWSKYEIEADSGSYSNGKIKIKGGGSQYKKGDSITVNVYTKKWFLGGKGKWLFSQKIPYNYETNISILTTGNFSKAPGDHVQFGVRKYFDNKMFLDKWAPVKKNLKEFVFQSDGVHISKSKDDLEIDDDPTKISNDKITLIALLAKNSAITDTLNVLLNYVANYHFNAQANGTGQDLTIMADIYHDAIINAQLLKIKVNNNATHKTYNYWVNTNGGSITISSAGGDGNFGLNGLDGFPGTPGLQGAVTTATETVTNADGTTTATTTTVTGPGGNGGNGQDGGDGQGGGAGGNGGNITINYSRAARQFLNLIKAISIPGRGGAGGRGGQGGTGGNGGIGTPNGNNGLNGQAGRSGYDGTDGQKGFVTLREVNAVR